MQEDAVSKQQQQQAQRLEIQQSPHSGPSLIPQNYRMPEEIGKNGRKETGEKTERKGLSSRQTRANAAIQRSRPLPCLNCVFRSHGYKVAVPFLCWMSES